ncbi:glycosylhydrolase-like jelly roll fold domain-containing protein [Paraglaciecola aquimarina]
MFVVFTESSKGVSPVSPDVIVEQDIQVLLDQPKGKNQQNTPKKQLSVVTKKGLQQVSLNTKQDAIAIPTLPESLTLSGPWQVKFDKKYGLDHTFKFTQLLDWRNHPDTRIQDYSGTAKYSQNMTIAEQYVKPGTLLTLDLGQVNIAATVIINGKLVATAWVEPYQLDITEFVKVGENQIEIEVANVWVNRLLADQKLPDTSGFKIARWQDPVTKMPKWYTDNQAPPPSERLTFSTQKFMSQDEPRQASGLVGPVQIKLSQSIKL